jgi:hypothetical protein
MSTYILEQNKQKTINDFINSGMPKVSIERILLETASLTDDKIYSIIGVSGTSRVKDPHIKQSVLDTPKDQSGDNLKVDVTLSLQGFLKKDTKVSGKSSGLWFDNINLASLVKTTVFQIDNEMKNTLFGLLPDNQAKKLNHPAIIDYLSGAGGIPVETRRVINISEILFQASNPEKIKKDKTKYITTAADGSIIYNLPYKLETFSHLDPNPSFLAYITITELDASSLREEIINSITADLPTNGPALGELINLSELEETISEMISQYSTRSINYDVVFNQKTVNDVAVLMQREDNQDLWFGNFHTMPDGTIMTGESHNDNSLSPQNKNVILTPIQVANSKIVDLRDDEEIEKVFLNELYQVENVYDSLSRLNKQPVRKDKEIKKDAADNYSFSFQSSHMDGSFSYILNLDKIKILLNNSTFGGIAQHISNLNLSSLDNDFLLKTINNIFAKTKITNLNVYRRRVSLEKTGQNKLGTPKIEQNSYITPKLNNSIENSYKDAVPVLIATYSDLGSSDGIKKINNIDILNSNNLMLTFKDSSFNKSSKGKYEYSYEAFIEDGISKELESLFYKSLDSFTKLKNYVSFIDSDLQKYYNDKLDIFNVSNIEKDYEKANQIDVNVMIAECFTSMHETWTILGINNSSLTSAQSKLLKIASPDTGNYQGLNKFFKLYNTFLEKMLSMSGFNKDILSIKTTFRQQEGSILREFITPNAAFGTIEKLDTLSTGLSKSSNAYKNTIYIKEAFTDIINLDENYRSGYEYLRSDLPADFKNTIDSKPLGNIEISSNNFQKRLIQEKNKYFDEEFKYSTIQGLDTAKYRMTYLTPARVYLNGRMKTVNRKNLPDAQIVYPKQVDFNFYKTIMLDILRSKVLRTTDFYSILEKEENEASKLVQILSNYGICIKDNIPENLSWSDPDSLNFNIEDSDEFVYSATDDYEDSLLEKKLYAKKIDFLLINVLNKLILKDSLRLSIYKNPIPDIVSQVKNRALPNSAKSLIINYDETYADSKGYIKSFNLEDKIFRNTSLSFETYGWWWLSYSNIVKIQYLHSADNNIPSWSTLTSETYNNKISSGQSIICKFVRYTNKDFGITNNEFLDLPILNRYFVINPGTSVAATSLDPDNNLLSLPFSQQTPPLPVISLAKSLSKIRQVLGADVRADLISDDSLRSTKTIDAIKNQESNKLNSKNNLGAPRDAQRATSSETSTSERDSGSRNSGY